MGTWLVIRVDPRPVAVFEDLEQIDALGLHEDLQAPVVEDQQVDPGETLEEAGVAPVAAGEGQSLEHPGNALIEDRSAIAAGFVAQGAGDPALADSGGADDGQVFVMIDPVAGDEPGEQRPVDAARCAQVDVLGRRVLAQAGELEACGDAAGVAVGGFAIGHDADALLEGQGEDVGRGALFLEGSCHAGEAKGDQTFVGRVGEHQVSSEGSMEVGRATDVAVAQGLRLRLVIEEGPVEAGLQDGPGRS